MRKRSVCLLKPCVLILMIILGGILNHPAFSQETQETITTYYPAPYGVYNQLVTNTLGVGDTNGSGNIDSDDAPKPDTDPGDFWIAGNVGIGTITPPQQI